jgi:hypothetical protein
MPENGHRSEYLYVSMRVHMHLCCVFFNGLVYKTYKGNMVGKGDIMLFVNFIRFFCYLLQLSSCK